MKGYDEDLYGNNRLKKRLEGQTINAGPETGRSISSLKSFKPDKLDDFRKNNTTNRSKASDTNTDGSGGDLNNDTDRPMSRKPPRKDKANVVTHKYISKIVCYI